MIKIKYSQDLIASIIGFTLGCTISGFIYGSGFNGALWFGMCLGYTICWWIKTKYIKAMDVEVKKLRKLTNNFINDQTTI